jgi:hypothetical protein
MKTTDEILAGNRALTGALRVLTGSMYSGKRAIYISGTPDGFRLLADLFRAQADAAEAPARHFTKLERESGELFFTTDDSVDIFEIHCEEHYPEKHEPIDR